MAPFHYARYSAASNAGDLWVLEVAGSQSDYNWSRQSPGFDARTIWPSQDYRALEESDVISAVKRELAATNPEVIVVPGWSFPESVAAIDWAAGQGVPLVLMMDSLPRGKASPKHIAKRAAVGNFASAFVAGTPHKMYLARLGFDPARCFIGCDVVDNDVFRSVTRPVPTPDVVRLVSLLRFVPEKRILETVRTLAAGPRNFVWTIAGDGPLKAAVSNAVDDLHLRDVVRLLDWVDYSSLPDLLSQHDVYLQPSGYEPWGLAVNEAMASGMPVLVSKSCGCAQDLVCDGRNGFLFDTNSRLSLQSGIQQMLRSQHRWREMGEASREIIAEWDLSLFSEGFWRSCEKARAGPPPSRLSARVARTALWFRT